MLFTRDVSIFTYITNHWPKALVIAKKKKKKTKKNKKPTTVNNELTLLDCTGKMVRMRKFLHCGFLSQ